MSFFENTRKPQGLGSKTIYNGEQLRTFINIGKNEKGGLCVKTYKGITQKT